MRVMMMRVIQINYAEADKLYNKTSLEDVLNVSVRTFDRYILNDDLKDKAEEIGRRKFYKGADINKRIDELVEQEEKFVLMD